MGKGKPQRRPRDYFYGEVLRLPPGTRQPDHYTLLGLAFFEKDHDTILRAALERIRLLDACDADPRPAYRQALAQLKVDVRGAQLTLLDPVRRDAYDRALTGSRGGEARKEDEDQDVEIPVGTMFAGRYRVLGEARRGALGIVYDALDSNLRTKVQLSVLRPSLSRRKPRRRRVEQAARQAALLVHPNIVHADEVGDEEGLVYLRMRAVQGRNVLELIESAPHMRLEPEDARRIMAEVAAALKYAHAQGAVHGDLRPHNVFVDGEGRVRIADFCTARAVADELDAPPGRYREPEDDPTPKADLFALGCLGYQMLTGMPPFTAGVDAAPRELPEDVPADLAAQVMGMLARDPERRPAGAAAVLDRLTTVRAPRRLPILLAVAGVFLVAIVAALMGVGSEPEPQPRTSVQALAWRLISEGKEGEAIARLRRARAVAPEDEGLVPPLAEALARSAAAAIGQDDPWSAQELLAEAQELEPKREREEAFARAREMALARLAAVPIEAPEVASRAKVLVRTGDVPQLDPRMEGGARERRPDGYVFSFDLKDGRHALPFVLTDRIGNTRAGAVNVVIDTVAPVLEIVEPAQGTALRDGAVRVTVRIEDENPAETIEIRGRPVPVRDGVASDVFPLGDGDHLIEVVGRDRAGHAARATRRVVVDSKAPGLDLAAARVVTRAGYVTVSGRVAGLVERVLVDGREVEFDRDGAFSARLEVAGDRLVPVVAVSATGLRKKLSVEVILDRAAPVVSLDWPRRGKGGAVLYGGREMDAGAVRLPLLVEDKTAVTFAPSEGRVAGSVWTLAPHQGARTVTLRATDESGNRTELEVALEGHRATPHLAVKCATKPVTTDTEAVLDIEADGRLFVQGRPAEPGKAKVPLPEGKVELVVKAVDRYGNEVSWRLPVVVDRTPPVVELVGSPERGIGRQELVIRSNEVLATVTCVGRTFQVNSKIARVVADLQTGRKRLHVVAKDLAGNVAKVNFPLSVRNRVLLLDGNDAVKVGLPDTLEAFTVEAWVRGSAPAGRSALLSKGSLADYSIMWGGSEKGVPYATLVGETSGVMVLSARKGWKWEEWTHVALAYDGRRARFYVDGSLQASVEVKEKRRRGKQALHIGAEPGRRGLFAYFAGAVDEVRVSSVARYTRAFSPTRHFREDESTVALLRFDTVENKRFPDSSGNGRHGEIRGDPRLQAEGR